MQKLFVLLLSLALFAGCSQRVHPHFSANRYVRNYNIHVINDSLQLYLKAPADIDFVTDKKALEGMAKQNGKAFKNVLLYGKTYLEPFYEFYLLAENPGYKPTAFPENTFQLDTIIGQQTFRIIGRSLDTNPLSGKQDLKNILNTISVGPAYRRDVFTVLDEVKKHDGSNNFLRAYQAISNFPDYDEQEAGLRLQMQLTFASFLQNHPAYAELLPKFAPEAKPDSISLALKQYIIPEKTGLEILLKEAGSHNLVMVNENHFMPEHRIFAASLLPQLKAKGYTYLALEALGKNQDSLLNLPGSFPTLETGFYTREQHFGNLIRQAKALGYTFVAYENQDKARDREAGQAENFYNKTFGKDSLAKVVVLAGIDHILEKPAASGKKWMATLLKEQYNLEPLTISQTHLSRYRKFTKEPVAIVNGKNLNAPFNSVDYHVFNNLPGSNLKKDGGNYTYKNRFRVPVQFSLFSGDELETASDHLTKIPLQAIYMKPNEKVNLSLPMGNYTITAYDAFGNKLDSKVIMITAGPKK